MNRQITKIMSESMEDMKLPFNGKVQKVSRRFSPYKFQLVCDWRFDYRVWD